ncbi:sulfotransferase 6B1-like [Discoglossus pictus]
MLRYEEFSEKFAIAKHMSEDDLLFNYEGILYPTTLCSEATFKLLENFETRIDDLLIASYPKSGTVWTTQVLNDMVYTIHNKPNPGYIPILEFAAAEKFEDINKIPSPRILGTHMKLDSIPESVLKNKPRILVVLRNPKDIAVSCYHFYRNLPILPTIKSWDEFFQNFMNGQMFWGSYFEYAASWNKRADDENVLIITYEEMKKDLATIIRKISSFCGLGLTDEQVHFVANKGHFKSMKEKSTETHGEFGQCLFRKGEIGDWRNHFSASQSQEFDAKFEALLTGTKVGEKFNYNVYCK